MLLKTRKKSKYLSDEIQEEVDEKWFSVYNYISLEELILTTRKDFLEILVYISTPFAIVTVILWMFAFFWSWFLFFFVFLFFVYFIIFLIVFFKLIYKTYLFLKISDVVYTKNWLMISDDIIYFKKDKDFLEKKLNKYEEIFDEYLWKPSSLEEVISIKKRILFESTKKDWKNIWNSLLKLGRSKNWLLIVLIFSLSFALYVAFLYISYYLWYFLSFLFSYIYIFFMRIILFFKDKVELKIKHKTLKIDTHLKKMHFIYKLIKNKIDKFKSGEISNLENFVEDKFNDFYTQIDLIIKEKIKLSKLIDDSKYKDFIDLNIFKKYLKWHFNKPVKDMISLLEAYEKLLNKQIKEIEKNNTGIEILESNLSKKEFILEGKLRILMKNKMMLSKSILK